MVKSLVRLAAPAALLGISILSRPATAEAAPTNTAILDWDSDSQDTVYKLYVRGSGRLYMLGHIQRTYGAFDSQSGIFGLDLSNPTSATFGTSGRFLTGPTAMVVNPDGSLTDIEIVQQHAAVVRRDPEGNVLGTPSPISSFLRYLDRQADGKILVEGSFDPGCLACATPYAKIVRLNADGGPDATFQSVQIATGLDTAVTQAVLLSDGRIVLLISSNLVMLNSDGTLATGFGLNSTVSFSAPIGSIAVDSQDRIYVLSGTHTVQRVLADGTIDSTFDGSAVPANQFTGLLLDSMQRPVLFGYLWPPSQNGGSIVRLTTTGALDTTFATTGTIVVTPSQPFDFAADSPCTGDLQTDDRPVLACVIAGEGPGAMSDIAIARYNPDGTPDNTLGASIPDTQYYPDPFAFQPASAAYGTAYVVSNPVTVSGINVKTPIGADAVSGGSLSIGCTGQFTNATLLISDGQTFCVRGSASLQPASPAEVRVSVGGRLENFTINSTNTPANTTPGPFSFTNQTDVELSATLHSNVVTITGITGFATVTVSGDNGFAAYSIGCGDGTSPFTSAPGKIGPGQTICVQQIASSTPEVAETATLTVGGVSADFTITTKAAATPPSNTSSSNSGGGGALDELSLAVLGASALVAARVRRRCQSDK